MLGRLIAKNMIHEGNSHSEEPSMPLTPHLNDEVKQKLYGTKHLDCTVSSVDRFRIVVAQELGQLMSRYNYQVVLDYVTARGSAMDHISVTELKEYIFGSPVRAKTRHKSDKFRVVANAGVLLVTRVFYAPNRDTRLAICLSLPEPFITALSETWNQISRWLDECQALLLAVLSNETLAFLPRDLRAHDPQISQSIIQSIHTLVLPLMSSHTEIPRLLLYPSSHNQFLSSWFKDVFHWLEIKDGHRLRFLPVLFAKIVQDFAAELASSDCSRIVIISGNMAVANKLIFIISALLRPRYNGLIHTLDESDTNVQPLNNGANKQSSPLKNNPGAQESDFKSYGTITGKGWEIPKRNTCPSSTSISSDETSAQVIQPSSIRSSSSSLQYLSSSLSSAYGSYGSWFGKRMGITSATTSGPSIAHNMNPTYSPSAKPSDFSDHSIFQLHNGSNSSLHQMLANPNRVTPLASPLTTEHEEFPWTSSAPSSPRGDHFRQGWASWSGSFLQNVDVKRNCNRITDTSNLDKAFEFICLFDSKNCRTTITEGSAKHAPVLEVPLNPEHHVFLPFREELLPKYTSYLPNFSPWFQLQGFPIALDAERKVLNAMKADLHTHTHSRTLLISLRSREIKDITVEKDIASSKNLLRTKKVFSSGKCCSVSPKFQQLVMSCESNIKRAMAIWDDIGNPVDKIGALQQIFEDICG
ncbi:LANO_0G04126g1_1 [Lachancea nothofagi CBS 11611]|uniref:Protein LST4 n=1 Tax=Lachancea nothofagi CBS 11611 TaxID=1266666 RepID=A0A1G4KFZ0_9SACH|nr:LANO_0G04126g1_1 [Lachancea nothofagi CBS 11611]